MTDSGWKQPFHNLRRILAKIWLSFFPRVTIIGVTGSYGKTNTTRAITEVLSQKMPVLQTDLNLDTIYNLPITILKLRPWHKVLVLEYGVDHKNEMDFHLSLVRPKIGVLTGVTPVHAEPELLGSLEGIIEEKGKLLEALPKGGWAILNWDDEYIRKMAAKTKAKICRYSLIDKKADFWAAGIEVGLDGTSFTLHSNHPNDQRKGSGVKVKIPLIGRHFVYTALAAVAAGATNGLTQREILQGLRKLKPLPGRMSLEKGPLGTILINDALRANPASTLSGLETLAALPCQGRRVAVLGEMGELGRYAEEEHKKIGRKLAVLKNIDFLVSVGPLQELTAKEAIKAGMNKNNVFWAKNVHQAAEILKRILKRDDILYLKGSLLRHMERVILLLEGKKINCRVVSCYFYNYCPDCPKYQEGV